ncbi:MAG: lysophospholipid acyltransferase family protein [Bernardetiaceae bacterium]
MMKRLLSWGCTPIFGLAFIGTLLVFHGLQWLALRLGGYRAHKKTVDYMNWCLMRSLHFAGARITLEDRASLPEGVPLIVISNHQSMFDVAMMGWLLRKHHPKYVSKQELAHGIPSVSFNLRHGGSVLINRKDPRQSIAALQAFGKYLDQNNYAGCIFPEGTRTRDGYLKEFRTRGTEQMLKYVPRAWIVPVVVYGNWRIEKDRFRPLEFGIRCGCTVLPPFEAAACPSRLAAIEQARTAIETAYQAYFPA